MVVEVVAESLDVRDDFVSPCGLEVAREQNKCNVADVRGACGRQTRHTLQLQRRVVTEENLRGVLNSSTTGINKLLQKDLAKDTIRLLAENCAENDGDTVVTSLDIDGLFLTVVNGSDLATLKNTLRGRFGGVFGGLFMQGLVLVKCLLEGSSHGIALKQTEAGDEVGAGFLVGRQVLEIDFYGEIIARLGRDDVSLVFAFENLLGTILDELLVALDVDGDEDLCL